jgi:hypothetical protein
MFNKGRLLSPKPLSPSLSGETSTYLQYTLQVVTGQAVDENKIKSWEA